MITKNETVSNFEMILIQWFWFNNQFDSKVLYTCVTIKSFSESLYISYIEKWFNGENSKPLETEEKINKTLVIN